MSLSLPGVPVTTLTHVHTGQIFLSCRVTPATRTLTARHLDALGFSAFPIKFVSLKKKQKKKQGCTSCIRNVITLKSRGKDAQTFGGRMSSMKVYFCGSIRGGRDDVEIYLRIVTKLQSFATVLTEHVGKRELRETGQITPGRITARVRVTLQEG